MMYKGYENDIIWRQIQEYLPVKNRIDDNNAPKEEWLETGKNQIHIDHYICNDAKGIVVIYTGYCIHALNTVFVASCDKWIRLDARGNKEGVQAEFSLDEEKLAFKISSEGEMDYRDNHSYPDESLMIVLKNSTDAIDMILHHLPDALGY